MTQLEDPGFLSTHLEEEKVVSDKVVAQGAEVAGLPLLRARERVRHHQSLYINNSGGRGREGGRETGGVVRVCFRAPVGFQRLVVNRWGSGVGHDYLIYNDINNT